MKFCACADDGRLVAYGRRYACSTNGIGLLTVAGFIPAKKSLRRRFGWHHARWGI